MAISLLDNFSLGAKKPNFARDLFDTVADMAAFSENYLPDVFECNVKENGNRYRYNVNNTVDEETGKWRLVTGEGSGSIEIDDNTISTDKVWSSSQISQEINYNWSKETSNLVPYPYINDKSTVINGVTFSYDEDGVISINGYCSPLYGNAIYPICDIELNGTCKLSGTPVGGSISDWYMKIHQGTGTGGFDFGEGFEILNANGLYRLEIFLQQDKTYDLTFKPMIVYRNSDGEYPSKYQKYGLGNSSLTREVDKLNKKFNNIEETIGDVETLLADL